MSNNSSPQKPLNKQIIYDLIQQHGLYLIPLCSINQDNTCTCGNLKCSSPGKHPYFKYNWKISASCDINQIKTWTDKHKNLNWGVLTGRRSSVNNKYLVVVDVDNKNHEIVNSLPPTFSYSTGNGYHYWFWSDDKIPNSVSKLDAKVDIRCSNGYVVIPPSKHRSGKQYKLLSDNIKIADLPDYIKLFLVDNKQQNLNDVNIPESFKKRMLSISSRNTKTKKFNKIKYGVKELRKIINKKEQIPMGIRNTSIHRLLSSDRTKGFEQEQLYESAIKYIECVEDPGSFGLNEVSTIVNSVLKYPPYCTLNKYIANVPSSISISKLNKDDSDFFKQIKPTNIVTCAINDIMSYREKWLSLKDISPSEISQFKYQEVSILLKEIGIKTKRTKNGNVWYCQAPTSNNTVRII